MNAAFALLADGRSQTRISRLVRFAGGAVLAATTVAVLVAALGAPIAVLLGTDDHVVALIVGATAIGTAWHLFVPLRWVPSSPLQIRRDVALRPRSGAFVYGAVLGTAVFTIVTTPFVWLGLLVAFLGGSFGLAAMYGIGFGAARAARLAIHWRSVRIHLPGDFLDRVLERNPVLGSRILAILGGMAIVALGAR